MLKSCQSLSSQTLSRKQFMSQAAKWIFTSCKTLTMYIVISYSCFLLLLLFFLVFFLFF